jgi:hypothetical protein
VVVQERVEASPAMRAVGDAERVQVGAVGGGGVDVTTTVASQVTEPPAPVAVSA